ncbi:MAG: glucose-6-phosphate dehydrogenase assembly protein OpcA [Chloroflexota bacterium]
MAQNLSRGPETSAGGTSGPGDGAADQAPGRRVGDIVAVGTRAAGGGRIELAEPPRPGEPTTRWRSRASSIDEIEKEISRIWSEADLAAGYEGSTGRQVGARTSVMNLVVIARAQETGARAASTISQLTGRHPSRTLIVLSADPDGAPWLDARIEAHCVLPRPDAPETCSELIFLTAGGETGQHLAALVVPLLIHDLPVTVWWPGEPPFGSLNADEILSGTDRLVVDGSAWSGDGLERLVRLGGQLERYPRLSIRDFALLRQSRWREAIATIFDLDDFMPFLPFVKRISVAYAAGDESGAPGTTNVIKPLYHVAWLASRLGMTVTSPLAPVEPKGRAAAPRLRPGEKPPLHRGLAARLRDRNRSEVAVVIRPIASSAPPGTTLRVEILAERRGSELRADVTAEAENVHVHTWLDGVEAVDRTFKAPRRGDTDLLAEAIEVGGRDAVTVGTTRMAAALAGARRTNDDGEPD